MTEHFSDADEGASLRKKDHIELAFRSQTEASGLDKRFYYEPLLSGHPQAATSELGLDFLGYRFSLPLWVSSMTGGTELAARINENLARAAGEFGFGMGLGSCRSLLTSDEYLSDFAVRKYMGYKQPLYANLGIAQVEQLLATGKEALISQLIERLEADGLILHINPLQEWLQPEGDRFEKPPLETIQRLIEALPELLIIVKEVGQGMGPKSLEQLLRLPLAALDFAAAGGTNFAKLELLRSQGQRQAVYASVAQVGHTAAEMARWVETLSQSLGEHLLCKQIIVSGGVQNFLDGYSLINSLSLPSVYGQASAFLQHARGNYKDLADYVQLQVEGLALAKAFLHIQD